MIRRLALAALLALTAPAQAQEAGSPQDEAIFTTIVKVDPGSCDAATAQKVTLADTLARLEALHGKCIAIAGFTAGDRLFASKRAAATAPPPWKRAEAPADARWIGLHGGSTRSHSATVVGVLEDCHTVVPGGGMIMGYCHDAGGGPILMVAQIVAPIKD